jgi:hypothetical protein
MDLMAILKLGATFLISELNREMIEAGAKGL